jgi:hypothetical protein
LRQKRHLGIQHSVCEFGAATGCSIAEASTAPATV